jgi:TP901-1 family phage major tail protein
MATTQVQGLNILVYVKQEGGEKKVLGGQKNCTLSMEADTIDVSNKNDFGWASFIPGAKSWTISCDGQFLAEDDGQDALMKAFLDSEEVEIEMSNAVLADETNNVEAKEATIAYTGKAVITSLELEAAFDDVFAYSAEFQGKGKLTSK